MKKLLSVITGLVAGSALYALPVANPAAPALLTDGVFMCDQDDCWGVKFGYRGDFVFNKHMKSGVGGRHQDFSLYSNEGVLTLNFWDRVDVYGFVGAANWGSQGLTTDSGAASEADFHSNTRTIGGVGLKAVLWETCWASCGTTYVGIDGQYEWMGNAPASRVTINGTSETAGGVGRKYREGQVSLAIGHRICNLVPYVAAKWSNGRAPLSHTATIAGFTPDGYSATRHWGYAIGVSLVDAGRMSVTAEARFIDESAFTIAGDIRF
ncbi:MAG: hypothetical protein P4L16_00450 [Chlamydiales bacterium]|nr:hypothetical protein [Chlamydiales bacterium]